MNILELLRPHLRNIKPYSSARDEYTGREGVFLDANENPFGSATSESFNRYPDPHQKILKNRVSEIKGVDVEKVFLGNGSDEPIDLIIRAFCEPGVDNLILTPPTYGMYEVSAQINNIQIKKVPLTTDFQLDVNNILDSTDERTKLIFLCSPNNPTGNRMNEEDIESIIQNFNGLVVLDEAYIDFSEFDGFIPKLGKYKNLFILQTLSKAWGLAALRLGMAFADKEIVNILDKIKPPYNINGATQKLALEALNNVSWKDNHVREILSQREILKNELVQLSGVIKVFPTDANFLLVKMDEAGRIFQSLIDQRIIVRDRSKVILCDDCLRITVGTSDENRRLLEALKSIKDE